MALKATIFKADLSIADMDRNYYADHALTLARHPSETDERMMLRILAFALNVPADDLRGRLDHLVSRCARFVAATPVKPDRDAVALRIQDDDARIRGCAREKQVEILDAGIDEDQGGRHGSTPRKWRTPLCAGEDSVAAAPTRCTVVRNAFRPDRAGHRLTGWCALPWDSGRKVVA